MPRLQIHQHLSASRVAPVSVRAATPAGLDLAGVVRAVSSIANEFEHRSEEARRSEANIALTNANSRLLVGAQADLSEEQARDDAGEGLAKRFASRMTQRFAEERKSVPAFAHRAFDEQTAQLRGRLELRAQAVELDARQGKLRRDFDAGLLADSQAVVAEPSMATDVMARRAASTELLSLPAEERAEMKLRARQQIAETAAATLIERNPEELLKRLGDGSPEAIQGDPVLSSLPAAKLGTAIARAKSADRMQRAQSAADELMTRALPLDQAMQAVERDYSGEDERAMKAEVLSRYSYAEAARKDREQEHYGSALLEVEQRGRVSPGTWSKLTDGHRAAVLNRQQAEARQRRMEAEGRPVKTDWALYLELREKADSDARGFLQTDLKQYVDKIGPGQMEQLIDIRTRTQAAQARPAREPVSLVQQMNATMGSLKIRKPEQRGQFLSYVQGEVDQATDVKGKPLTYEERQQIIDRAVLQGPDPDALLWGEKRMYQLTPEQRGRFRPIAPTDAPATEIDALNDALRSQGLAQTPANRLAAYNRANKVAP